MNENLRVRNIHFGYNKIDVLSDISFEVNPGEILGLLDRTVPGRRRC